MDDLQQRIFSLAKDLQLMNVATIAEDGNPHARPVVGKVNEDLVVRFSTHLDSAKIKQFKNNPHVHVVMGVTDVRSKTWLQIDGIASVSTSKAERQAFWFDGLLAFVSGVDDPRYSIVIIQPTRIELHSIDNPIPDVWLPVVKTAQS
jgi:general stress protein 26